MKIEYLRTQNFMSFVDTGRLEFRTGINVIVGQNDSGKSALLRSLVFPLTGEAHRDKDSFEDYEIIDPSVEVGVSFQSFQLEKRLLQTGKQFQILASPRQGTQEQLKSLFGSPVEFRIGFSGANFALLDDPVRKVFGDSNTFCSTLYPKNGKFELSASVQLRSGEDLQDRLTKIYIEDLFYFNSERYSIGRCLRAYATRLLPNASNLPAVLDTIKGERGSLFQRLIEHMREIFTSFGNLSIRPSPQDGNFIEVLVWPEQEMPRKELAFPLEKSGTGISQVLALLTAVISLDSCVIVIDEINSFLHPAATKALMRILFTNYNYHQYIISSHAAEVISCTENNSIFIVKKSGYVSSIVNVEINEKRNFQEIANLLGISMTDVFSADRVLWVEGPTEEQCFSYLYTSAKGNLPRGLAIISATTGDFIAKKRDRALIYEIYQKLCSASSSLVVTVGFSFDSEKLTVADRERMTLESGGLVNFLPRRHIECYLVDAEAIAAFINDQEVDKSKTIDAVDVKSCLERLAQEPNFVKDAPWLGNIEDEEWLKKVDAARLIDKCCGELSEFRVSYMKKGHALMILQHIMKKDPHKIEELVNYVLSMLP